MKMDDKNNTQQPKAQEENNELSQQTWVDDMKQELEDYIEEQGIYIRQ